MHTFENKYMYAYIYMYYFFLIIMALFTFLFLFASVDVTRTEQSRAKHEIKFYTVQRFCFVKTMSILLIFGQTIVNQTWHSNTSNLIT